MADLIIYDSARSESKWAALLAMVKLPGATIRDFVGLTAAQIDTYIGTLVAETYDKIYVFVNNQRVEAVKASGVVTVTNKGADTDMFIVKADDLVLGYALGDAGGTETSVAQALKTSINEGSALHGFVASGAAAAITISAPLALGADGDDIVLAVVKKGAGAGAANVSRQMDSSPTGVTAVGVSGDITEEDFIDLEAKVKAAVFATGAAQAGANTTITLVSTASAVTNYYKGMTILITANTGAEQVRVITAYNGTTKVATVDFAWGTNPAADSTYVITEDLHEFGRAISTRSAFGRAWDKIIGTNTTPTIVNLLGNIEANVGLYSLNGLTTTGTAAGTLTDSSAFVADAYKLADHLDMPFYVAIKTSSTARAAGQIRKISTNTVNALTIVGTWAVTPHATVTTYQVGKNKMLWDEYLKLALPTMFNFTGHTFPAIVVNKFKPLVDKYNGIETGSGRTFEDADLLEEVIAKGEAIFKAKSEGVV